MYKRVLNQLINQMSVNIFDSCAIELILCLIAFIYISIIK